MERVYQRLVNSVIQERLQGENIVKSIKTQRLQWYGHIRKMGEEKVVKSENQTLKEQEVDSKADGRNRY